MGAYYEGTVRILEDFELDDNEQNNVILLHETQDFKRYCSHSFDNGLKLAEHGYLLNPYVNAVLNTIPMESFFNLIWLCDYSEDANYNWSNIQEIELTKEEAKKYSKSIKNCYYVNEFKKEYIDIKELKYINKNSFFDGWMIHPLVVLTNSECEVMGGGEFHFQDNEIEQNYNEFRKKWLPTHILKRTLIKPDETYENITNFVMFKEI